MDPLLRNTMIRSLFLTILPLIATAHPFFSNHLPINDEGKIQIDPKIQHIKLDIGLSWCAPMSQVWLSQQEDDLLVFGFEPNPEAVSMILEGKVIRADWALDFIPHEHPLRDKSILLDLLGSRFFLLPCALGQSENSTIPFYVTSNDCGCSSIYPPIHLPLAKIIEVPIFPLATFLSLFPFDTHPRIDYIKIDAQGADLDIIKSAADYMEHVVCVTIEAEDSHYEGTHNSFGEIDEYMRSINFVRYISRNTEDPTYVNRKHAHYFLTNKELQIFQK
jgi:FkbM family methyltransferase